MKEFIVLILGIVLLVAGIFAGSEYDLYKDKWKDYYLAGIVLYVIILISLVVLIRKKERQTPDILPDTKYTKRFEKF